VRVRIGEVKMVMYIGGEVIFYILVTGLALAYFLRSYAPLMTLIHRHSLAFDIMVIFGSIFGVYLFLRLYAFPY
jgi:hypothetical protein